VSDDDTQWVSGTVAVPSSAHLRSGSRCQDAVTASHRGRRYVAVFDGRGSAQFSELGSTAAAEALPRILEVLEPLLRETLDAQHECSAQRWSLVGETILRALRDEQRRVAEVAEVATCEVEFTVSIAISGERRIGCIQLGDSAILIGCSDRTVALALHRQEGEFACETYFLGDDDSSIARANYRISAAEGVVALLVLSDGVAHAWLDATSGAVAAGVRTVIARLRSGEWDETNLMQHLRQRFWSEIQDDDRSVAFVVGRAAATDL
jgi:hypothetical protein